MPTFDFHCTACDHVFEFTRSFGSSAVPACPKCGAKDAEKLIAPPAIQFRGSGFYKTDSRSVPPAKTGDKTDIAGKERTEGNVGKVGKVGADAPAKNDSESQQKQKKSEPPPKP